MCKLLVKLQLNATDCLYGKEVTIPYNRNLPLVRNILKIYYMWSRLLVKLLLYSTRVSYAYQLFKAAGPELEFTLCKKNAESTPESRVLWLNCRLTLSTAWTGIR